MYEARTRNDLESTVMLARICDAFSRSLICTSATRPVPGTCLMPTGLCPVIIRIDVKHFPSEGVNQISKLPIFGGPLAGRYFLRQAFQLVKGPLCLLEPFFPITLHKPVGEWDLNPRLHAPRRSSFDFATLRCIRHFERPTTIDPPHVSGRQAQVVYSAHSDTPR